MFSKKKKSFLEKITGGINIDDYDYDDEYEEEVYERPQNSRRIAIEEETPPHMIQNDVAEDTEEVEEEGQLAVDVINGDGVITVRTLIAGVKPSDIDIDIGRDMVTIRGTRHEEHTTSSTNYHHQELYWGTFSRHILLPEEVDVDASKAKEKHGILTLTLPKIDKFKKTKLEVKSSS